MKTTDRYLNHVRLLEREDQARFAPMLTGRWGHGHGRRKLDEQKVLAIRYWSAKHTRMDLTVQSERLAPVFHVKPATIYDVLTHQSWAKVT